MADIASERLNVAVIEQMSLEMPFGQEAQIASGVLTLEGSLLILKIAISLTKNSETCDLSIVKA